MKQLYIFLFIILVGCGTKPLKPTLNSVDYDFYFADVFKGESASYDPQLDLRVMVSQARVFNNRLEQIQWALEITDYALNLDMSVVDFKKLPPSPYLSFNKLVTIKHYLRLSGFNGQRIVVDSANKNIIYLNDNHPFFNNVLYFVPKTDIIIADDSVQNSISSTLENSDHLLDDHQVDEIPLTPINSETLPENKISKLVQPEESPLPEIVEIVPNETFNTDELTEVSHKLVNDVSYGSDNLTENTHEALSNISDEAGELKNDIPDFGITVDLNTVVEKTEQSSFEAKGSLSLREIFTQLADFYGLNFVSSMGGNDWFLNSTINHDYEFTDLDHALNLILNECNDILDKNNVGFLLKASINNGILDLYYEK